MANALPIPGPRYTTPTTGSGPNVIPLAREHGPGFLRVVSPAELDQRTAEEQQRQRGPVQQSPDDLGSYIRSRWEAMRNHRNSTRNPLNERLLRAQRMFEGQYDPSKLTEIRRFGGSEVYSRIVAVKCRGATSLLRDVYLGAQRPWSIDPQPDPPVPPEVMASIAELIATEAAEAHTQMGMAPKSPDVHGRFVALVRQAQQAARRTATQQAEAASNKVEDILEAGNFYDALAEFLVDVALFPFAVMKGPVVRMVSKLTWNRRQPTMEIVPQLFWERVDPFNFYWDPGATDIENAELIERKKLSRTDLNDVLGLPGYNDAAIRGALEDYAHGLHDWMDAPDTEMALNAGRESPQMNRSNLIDAIEYHGNIQGSTLLNEGVDESQIPDPDRDYLVQSWVVGRHTIKTQITPSPRRRHPYYITSFEKVPGNIAGHGLPDILEDIQEVANATLRALVNNMSIASGPQVVLNTELLDPTTNEDQLYPWKRWRVNSDPLGSTQAPVTFFQPQSNAQELMTIYSAMSAMGDDTSAIPRYVTGESISGGAGRTASGLSMLMGNAQKVLQTVAANIDIDVMRGVLQSLYDMIMLTDQSGLLSGDEQIKVNGVVVALQKETEQQKQLQFLQITANPIDMSIVGMTGRGRVLRSLATGLGMPDDIVPDDDTIQQKEQQQQQSQQVGQMAQLAQAASKAVGPGAVGAALGIGGGLPSGGAPPLRQGAPAGPNPAGPSGPAGAPGGAPPPPPLPGARLAPDGQHYIPDPRPGRQGKYLMVR